MAVLHVRATVGSGVEKHDPDSPWLYLSKPNALDKVRVEELYGGVPDAERVIEQKCSSILNSLQVDLGRMINLQSLLPHLISRSLLTENEMDYMSNPHVPKDSKMLKLNTYIHNKGKSGIARFYLCLMDTWGFEGLHQHYDMAAIVRKAVLNEFNFNADDVYQRETDVYEVINRMPNRLLIPELAIQLIQALGVVIHVGEDYTPELKMLCSMWLRRTDTEHTLDRLVEVLLCTPGAGHLVTGLVPVCRSNPPVVSNFLRNTVKRCWEHLAAYLGIPSTLVDSVKASYSSSLRSQLQRFLIVWRVPDCERLEDILYSMYDRVQSAGADSSGYSSIPDVEQSQDEDIDVMLGQFDKQLKISKECAEGPSLGHPQTGSQKIPLPCNKKVRFHDPVVSLEEDQYGSSGIDVSYDTEFESSDVANVEESEREEEKKLPPLQPQSFEPSQDAGRDLVKCCLEPDWDCARVLIESGSELEGRSQDGLTPLMICCKKGNIEMVELIINHGGTLKATDNNGQYCLHFDEVVKNLPLLKFLVECFHAAGISVEQYAKNWYTPLLVACLAGERFKDAVEVLLEAGADPNGHSRAAHRPLTVASAAGDSGIFHTLIDHGADIDVQDRSGCTPLLCSCLRYHHQLVEFLIARDACLNLSDNHGNTPLFACVESGAHDLVRKLLERGAPVDIIRIVTKRFMAGSVEETPLAHCCGRGDLEMAKLLVAYGANINRLCAGPQGTVPPVGFAIICWQFVMVEYMIGLDGFDKTTLGLSRPLIIGIKCENWVATHLIIVKFFGSLTSAMQEANSGGYSQLYQQLLIFMEKTSGRNLDTMLQNEMESAAVLREELRTEQHDTRYAIQQNLQKFCQICVSVLKANTDLTEVASVAMAEGHHHISDFFLECNTNTLTPQQLNTDFLYGQPSPLRFSLEKKLLSLENFVHHTDLFFPGRADEFFTDLVHTFHEMNGSTELPAAVDECLDRLFSLQLCPAVSFRVKCHPHSYQLPGSAEVAVLGPQHSEGSCSGFDPFLAAATTSNRDHHLSTTPPTIVERDGQNAPPTSTVQTGETDAMNSSKVNGGQEATPTMINNLSIETDESLSPPAVPPQLHPPSSHPQLPSHDLPVSAPDQPAASTLSSHSSANMCTPVQPQSDEPIQQQFEEKCESELLVPKQECFTTDQIVYADYIHGLKVCLKASKKKEQQLQTQLDTVQHEYQDKEQQCSKLEQELHVMEKRMAVVTDKLEQSAAASEPSVIDKGDNLRNCVEVAVQVHDDSASDYNQLLQQVTTITDKLTASKKEQQHLQSSLEQWQRMGRARDQQMLKLKNENEVLQSKLINLEASHRQQLEASRHQLQAVLKEEIKLQAELVRKVQMSRLKESLISQKSVSTVDTSVQANYLAVAPDFLRGMEVYGETVLEVVGDKPQKLQWPGYGFYLEVPDGALAPGVTASVGVKMILSGQFKLPENSQLISAIYWISSSEMFLKEVAVNIQHCAVISTEEQCSKFRFIVAKCSQKVFPYTFREREGSFNVHTPYAAIKVKQFSMFGGTAPEGTELRYAGLVFYKPIPDTLRVDIVFVIVPNHEPHLKTIMQYYAAYEEDKLNHLIRFEEDAVELDLPIDPPIIVNCWKILPLTYPKIIKDDIQWFKPGIRLPACSIEIQWIGEGEQQEFSRRVIMKGAKKPNNFFQMRYYPQKINKPAVTPNQAAITNSIHTESTQASRELNVNNVVKELSGFDSSKWRDLGLQVDVPHSQLNTIATNVAGRAEEALSSTVDYWLRNDLNASWEKLANAVEKCNHAVLAHKIRGSVGIVVSESVPVPYSTAASATTPPYIITQASTTQQSPPSLHPSAAPCILAKKPFLDEVIMIDDKFVIADIVGCSYRQFATFLLKDNDGKIVEKLEEKHKNETAAIVYDVLSLWANGRGRECTWKHVLLALKACGHRQDAETIQQHLVRKHTCTCSEHF